MFMVKQTKRYIYIVTKPANILKLTGRIRQLAKHRLSKYQMMLKQKPGTYLHFILLFLIQYYCKIQFTRFKTWKQPTFLHDYVKNFADYSRFKVLDIY